MNINVDILLKTTTNWNGDSTILLFTVEISYIIKELLNNH
jgi:hypothetical protein